ncbi:MAG: DUF2752 domain-containing protein [Bacteroidales bacterium]|nr:DUF2752 domain-containing protein [Bacteroidales bacterium]
MESIIKWLESHGMPCFYKKYFGIECPGCGMQTAFIELLKGNISESIIIYPALLPTIFMIIYLILHIIFKFRQGALVLKISFIFTASIIVINYICKLLT